MFKHNYRYRNSKPITNRKCYPVNNHKLFRQPGNFNSKWRFNLFLVTWLRIKFNYRRNGYGQSNGNDHIHRYRHGHQRLCEYCHRGHNRYSFTKHRCYSISARYLFGRFNHAYGQRRFNIFVVAGRWPERNRRANRHGQPHGNHYLYCYRNSFYRLYEYRYRYR